MADTDRGSSKLQDGDKIGEIFISGGTVEIVAEGAACLAFLSVEMFDLHQV